MAYIPKSALDTIRPFDTAFQPNLSSSVFAKYNVEIGITSAIAGVNVATVSLQISPDGTTWTEKDKVSLKNSGVVSTQGTTQTLFCTVPAGYYVKMVKTATGTNSASAVFVFNSGQEIV